MISRRPVGLLALLVIALAVLVVPGRLESASATDAQVRGIERMLATVGREWGWATTASEYRLTPYFDCLLYKVGENPQAIELCFDWYGRVIEAIDRRGASAKFWTLQYDPSASPLRVDLYRLTSAFNGIDYATYGSTWSRGGIPRGYIDLGPFARPTYAGYKGPH
jgi:hypothetical protein